MTASLVLVDSSVWADHFARADDATAARIATDPLCTHDFVLGELILGHIPRRHPAWAELQSLRRLPTSPHDEVVAFVRTHGLEGSGIGWIDAHLLLAAKLGNAAVWTTDKSLVKAAARVGIRT